MIYEVTQTLAKTRVVRVEAKSKQDAIERAQEGYGEVVSPRRERFQLLCSEAIRLESQRERDARAYVRQNYPANAR